MKTTFSHRLRIDPFDIDIEDLSLMHWSLQGHLKESEQPISQFSAYVGDTEVSFDSLAEVAEAKLPDVIRKFDFAFACGDRRVVMVCDGKAGWFAFARVVCDGENEAWGRAAVEILRTTLRRHRVWNWWMARPAVLFGACAVMFGITLALPLPYAALPFCVGLGIGSTFFLNFGPASLVRLRRSSEQDAKAGRRARKQLSAEP